MVYTDGIHLVADSEEELHAFARKIGLHRVWYQHTGRAVNHPHYDLTTVRKRVVAIEMGAMCIPSRTLVELSKAMKNKCEFVNE